MRYHCRTTTRHTELILYSNQILTNPRQHTRRGNNYWKQEGERNAELNALRGTVTFDQAHKLLETTIMQVHYGINTLISYFFPQVSIGSHYW